ncbi:hypothetical protein [Clostridium tyrobutyricum]|uniref:hypothetical protein n=1 Tax=Clostridium tyrobutyricum TaxID=1519 RepID=UPI001C3901BC|nr:hypothetical protein [Clostridium tyrobutyricum]MBV4417431.1 hypothetical protein [Clostridium tyrobutyricum]
MGKRLFGKKVKKIIYEKMEEVGAEITQSQVIEIIEPYIEAEIDIEKLKESHKKTIANRLISSFRDDKGLRSWYAIREKTNSRYINVEQTTNIKDTEIVDTSIENRMVGLRAAQNKVHKIYKQITGQISIDDLNN